MPTKKDDQIWAIKRVIENETGPCSIETATSLWYAGIRALDSEPIRSSRKPRRGGGK